VPDWLPHGIAYAILSVLVARALSGGTLRPLSATDALWAVLIAALYGVSDEWHQSFTPGRDPSVADVAKDLAGAMVAVSVYRLACRRGPVPERARLG
jgi:VanZ family protein